MQTEAGLREGSRKRERHVGVTQQRLSLTKTGRASTPCRWRWHWDSRPAVAGTRGGAAGPLRPTSYQTLILKRVYLRRKSSSRVWAFPRSNSVPCFPGPSDSSRPKCPCAPTSRFLTSGLPLPASHFRPLPGLAPAGPRAPKNRDARGEKTPAGRGGGE